MLKESIHVGAWANKSDSLSKLDRLKIIGMNKVGLNLESEKMIEVVLLTNFKTLTKVNFYQENHQF